MISSDEQRKRREAMEAAIRTVEMEGFTFTEEEKKVFEDIVLDCVKYSSQFPIETPLD